MGTTLISLPKYQIIEQIYSGTRTLVYRAKRESDQQLVIIKLMRSNYPSFNELVQFRNQYVITKQLDLPSIIKTYSLEVYQNGYALVMEDFGGIAVSEYLKQRNSPLTLTEFFAIALELTDILNQLYHHRIIHKDIKPANILINPDTKQVKLIDFSIASLLPKETQAISSPNILEGTLAYLAPEQTGRMNRGIDYRSDFYALGVTFFELLTGQLPFPVRDLMELVYSHIAKQPPTIHSLNPEIPLVLSKIVAKLMAKNAEDRYQSALGLKYDLEQCLSELQTTGKITEFKIGRRDGCDRFLIPEKLYGRENEVKTLLAAFDRVSNNGAELILVAGFSGIGKTAIVNEVHKPIVRQRGYFIKGKFDQFNRNIPFSTFVQALRDLMGQLLSESNTQLNTWRTEILTALGDNAQVIIEVIPELEQIIGKQVPVPELSAIAAQNRFNLVFLQFIQVFTRVDHPLVIFLDDLQWADSASLKLIQLLMSQRDNHYLLIIGAYRDNEVSAAHPLMLTIQEMQKSQVIINSITLKPLQLGDLNHLIADTLNCDRQLAIPLTELLYQKTQGNPFFAHQFLKHLYEERIISFNLAVGYWECDISQVRALALTDDIVEFMALRLQKLPETTKDKLKLAACIGNQFDLETLAIVSQKIPTEVANELWIVLQEGLVIPTSEVYKFYQLNGSHKLAIDTYPSANYKFLHDRVQQAAYSLIPAKEKQSIHLQIGQMVWSAANQIEREEKIFEIVNHFNQGADLISGQTEKNQLANLNLIAGRKAKASTAYAAAVEYLNLGLQLLPLDSWQTQYDLTLKLHIEAIEAEYLNANFNRSNSLATVVLQQSNSLLDRVRVYEVQMQMHIAKLELLKTIDIGLEVLAMLGIALEKPAPLNLEVEDLAALPEMIDPQKLAAMRILMSLISAAYFANPPLLFPIILTIIHLSLKNGNCSYSAYGYVLYGLLLCGPLADIESGYRYGKLALQLLDKFNAKELKCKILLVFNGNVRHWKEHTQTTIEPLLEAIQAGIEMGDIEYAGYATTNYCDQRAAIGESLEVMEQQRRQYIDLMQKFKQEHSINYQKMGLQMILNLQGKAANKHELIGVDFDETKMLPTFFATKAATLLFYFHCLKGRLLYLFKASKEAVKLFKIAEEYIGSVAGMVTVGEHNFYYSLALLGMVNSADVELANASDRQTSLAQVASNQANMKIWANSAPPNFQHKYDLVEAERAKTLGDYWQAAELYDRAIAGAKEFAYLHQEALANELAAEFYLDRSKEKIAQVYLIEAYYSYVRWGAKAKTEELEQRYPKLLAPILKQPQISFNIGNTISDLISSTAISTSRNISDTLDIGTVLSGSQALSSEIQLENLLSTLMQVMMENAGADKCALILLKDEKLVIEATAVAGSASTLTEAVVMPSVPLETSQDVPISLINYVFRTQKNIVVDDAINETSLTSEIYIQKQQPKSLLCTPILNQRKLVGILYLENNLTIGAFTRDRLQVLKILTTQAAISLENAQLYQKLADRSYNLEIKVEERTQELTQKATQLESTLQKLYSTQSQLIQAEKMSSLGQLVAGIAHEINNPVNFIHGNLSHASEYITSLIELIELYQQLYPQPQPEIQAKMVDIELDFIIPDLKKLLGSMEIGSDRIRQIVESLRNFSRLDESEIKLVDIRDGIDSTLLILQHRLKGNSEYQEIQIIKEYGDLPLVKCYASALNQVFMNILSNAIDALRQAEEESLGSKKTPKITIQAGADNDRKLLISIADNGLGMDKAVVNKIFEPFFTTKPVGSGTGLGLSISYSIVVEKHQGQLSCTSTPGEGSKFIIEIPLD